MYSTAMAHNCITLWKRNNDEGLPRQRPLRVLVDTLEANSQLECLDALVIMVAHSVKVASMSMIAASRCSCMHSSELASHQFLASTCKGGNTCRSWNQRYSPGVLASRETRGIRQPMTFLYASYPSTDSLENRVKDWVIFLFSFRLQLSMCCRKPWRYTWLVSLSVPTCLPSMLNGLP